MTSSDSGFDQIASGLGLASANPPISQEPEAVHQAAPAQVPPPDTPEPAPLTPPAASPAQAPLPAYEGTHLDTSA